MPLYSPQGPELYNLEHTEHLREDLHEEKSIRRIEVLFSEFPAFSAKSDTSGIEG